MCNENHRLYRGFKKALAIMKKSLSRFFVGWRTDRRNRKIANQGKEEVIITVTVADSFSDLDLVVETFELAGAD